MISYGCSATFTSTLSMPLTQRKPARLGFQISLDSQFAKHIYCMSGRCENS